MSFPHQPPRYGVSSGWPVRSGITGPTSVPCRVITPSSAAAAQLMRRITFSSSPTMCSACLSQSLRPLMKNVVFPESP